MYSHLRKNLLAFIEAFRTPFSIPFDSNPYFSKSAQKPTQRYLPAPTTIPPDDPSPKKTPDQRTAAAGMASRRYFEDWGFPSTASSPSSSVSMDVSHGKPAFSLSLRLRPAPGANVLFRSAKFSRFNQPTHHPSITGRSSFPTAKTETGARNEHVSVEFFARSKVKVFSVCDLHYWPVGCCYLGRRCYCFISPENKSNPSLLLLCRHSDWGTLVTLWSVFVKFMYLSGVWLPSSNLWLWQSVSCKSRKGWKGNRKVPICGKHLTGYTEISFRRAICVVVREVGSFHINTEQKEAL